MTHALESKQTSHMVFMVSKKMLLRNVLPLGIKLFFLTGTVLTLYALMIRAFIP